MSNCLSKRSTSPKGIYELKIEETSLDPSIRRRGVHSTSLQLILKDALAQWEYVSWDGNTLQMREIDFYYDSELNRMRGGYATNSAMKPLSDKIKRSIKIHRWKGIKSFSLSVMGYQSMGDGLVDLVKGVNQGLPELQNHGGDNLGLLISRELRMLKSLRPESRCDEIGLKRMISHLSRNLYNLDNLYIVFPGSIQNDNAKAIISTTAKHLVKLKVLELDFSFCKNISDLGLSEIASELTRHKLNLLSLTLHFRSITQMLNQGMEVLVSRVCQGFKNLKDLTLDFSEYPHLNNESLQLILRSIPQYLGGLERLQLNFRGCRTLTTECVKFLAFKVISSLTKLRELKLNFAQNQEVSDNAIEALLSIDYKKLPHLEKIDFNFYFCNNITSKGVQALIALLKKNLNNFKLFTLHFYWQSTINKEINILKQEFKDSSNFELIDRY